MRAETAKPEFPWEWVSIKPIEIIGKFGESAISSMPIILLSKVISTGWKPPSRGIRPLNDSILTIQSYQSLGGAFNHQFRASATLLAQ
jgi:hypothetical protein